MEILKPSKGKLLVAEPSILNDSSFNRSIVLLSEHNEEGAIGFINPVSEPFCGACSRMRLTSDAKLRPCLMTDREIDIREAINHATPIEAIQEMFLVAAHRKVESGIVTPVQRPRTMMTIGG